MNAAHAALRWLQHGSLRLRLLLGTLVWLVLAVAVAAWGCAAIQEHSSSSRTSWCASSTSSAPPSTCRGMRCASPP
jgi:hypothetical protein